MIKLKYFLKNIQENTFKNLLMERLTIAITLNKYINI